MIRCNYPGVTIPGQPDLDNIYRLDRSALPMIGDMMRIGTAVDVEFLHGMTEILNDEISTLEAKIKKLVPKSTHHLLADTTADSDDDTPTDDPEPEPGAEFNPNSSEQKAWLLYDILGLNEGKEIKRTARGDRFSVGKKEIEKLKSMHEVVPLILAHGERIKLRSTYTRSLPRKVKLHKQGVRCDVCGLSHHLTHHRIHTTFTSTRAATGRLASKGPNLQNIPVRTDLGQMVRLAFYALSGWKLVGADYSQIELRLLAHLSKDPGMIKVFHDGLDLHTATAMDVQGITDPKLVDPKVRRGAKTVNFGIVYGLTPPGLQASLILEGVYWTLEECEQFIEDYFARRPQVRVYMRDQEYRIERYGFTWDMWGRVRYQPGVYSVHKKIREEAKREAGNMPIQGSACGVMKLGMAALYNTLRACFSYDEVRPLLTIHDEIILEVVSGIAEEVKEMMVAIMESVVDLRVPVLADGKVSDRWVK